MKYTVKSDIPALNVNPGGVCLGRFLIAEAPQGRKQVFGLLRQPGGDVGGKLLGDALQELVPLHYAVFVVEHAAPAGHIPVFLAERVAEVRLNHPALKEPRWGVRGLPLLLALAPELFQPPVKGFAVFLKGLCRDAQLFCVFSEGFRALLLPEWVILHQIHRRESGF